MMINKFSRWQHLLIAMVAPAFAYPNIAARPATDHEPAVQNTATGGDFALTDQNGSRFLLREQRGKVVLLFFGYTTCPDACPAMLAKLASVYKALGQKKSRVLTVFVSVDPARDTPEALKKYLAYFPINAAGLTGTKEEIDAVVKQYGAYYEIEKSDSALGYHINHSTTLYVIDQSGEVKLRFKHTDRPDLMAAAVQQLIE
jgi:protein SCO1/2